MKLESNDFLRSAHFVSPKDDVLMVTAQGQAIRFLAEEVRQMGRSAAGVRAIKLAGGDQVVAAEVVPAGEKEAGLLILTATGYGKITAVKEYKRQKRGGTGIKTAKLTAKTGPVIAASVINKDSRELVAMSKKSQVLRTDLSEISWLGRVSQGVRIMKLREGDEIASFLCLKAKES